MCVMGRSDVAVECDRHRRCIRCCCCCCCGRRRWLPTEVRRDEQLTGEPFKYMCAAICVRCPHLMYITSLFHRSILNMLTPSSSPSLVRVTQTMMMQHIIEHKRARASARNSEPHRMETINVRSVRVCDSIAYVFCCMLRCVQAMMWMRM